MNNHTLRFACAAALCTPFTFAIVNANASPDPSTGDNSVDEVVVVANRAPEPLSKVGNSVTVLNDADIKASQLTVVSDLLAQTPGVNMSRTGGVGQPTSIFIRGADSDQTVVIIDGVQLNDPSTTAGGFDFENLLTGNISRIEILRGAQSTLYGSQAMGGVINITTADPTASSVGGLDLEGGSHNTGYAAGNIGGREGGLMWRISGDFNSTSGIPAFDEKFGGTRLCESKIEGGSGQVRYDLTPDLQLDLRGYYVKSRTDFDGYDTPLNNPPYSFGNDREFGEVNQVLGYGGLTLRSPDRALTNRIAFQYTSTNTREYDPDAPANFFSPSTETFFGIGRNEREEYQGTWEIGPRHQLVFGAQHERSTIDTDTPAFDYSGPAPVENEATIDSGYAQLQGEIMPGLTLTAGERYDRHNEFGGHTAGAVAAAWALNGGETIFRTSFSQGFKAPSLYQLYSPYQRNPAGSSTLRPEAAETWDAAVERHLWKGRASLSAAYFQRYSRDLIAFFNCPSLTDCPNPFGGYYANLARAAAHGVELQATVNPLDQWNLSANYTLTDTEDKSPGSPTFGNELARRPKNTANASTTYHWSAPLSANVALRYAGPSFDDAGNERKLGGYVILDLRVTYALRERIEIDARIENATGKHYETAYLYGQLGRVAYAGLRATF